MRELTFGLSVAAIGMITVFVGLVILIAAIVIVSKLIGAANRRREETPVKPESVSTPVQTEYVEEPAADQPEEDAQLTAVIAAAIMACQETGVKMVVKSVRRVNAASAWAQAGRREQLQ